MICQCCSNNKPDDAFLKLGRIGETSARGFAYSYICDMCYSLWLLGCIETTYIGGAYSYRSTECDKKDVANKMNQYKTWFKNNERHSQIRRREIAAAVAVTTKRERK